jgi:hypothetical protein
MRSAGALLLIAFLLWLPVEDTHIWLVVALAASACAWLALRHFSGRALSTSQAALCGAAAGGAVPLLAVALMAFKGGLHGHGFSDFSVRQIAAGLALLPLTAGLGMLAAFALRLGALRRLSPPSHQREA